MSANIFTKPKINIKIFLASSIEEFADERQSLKNFIRQIKNVVIDHNIMINMFICEFSDKAITNGRKQEQFLTEIDDCNIFLLLIGKKMGKYTFEEYEYAKNLKKQQVEGFPIIIAGFKICDDSESTINVFFENIPSDTLKLKFTEITDFKEILLSVILEILKNELTNEIQQRLNKIITLGNERTNEKN
ncbi:MAG: DUF4062 domain-containing protein [Candidatus Cloacimonetes bacterium]|nr:DUF4062 domain-containing protein [Candidatus Cloacimonadota bacterium]